MFNVGEILVHSGLICMVIRIAKNNEPVLRVIGLAIED